MTRVLTIDTRRRIQVLTHRFERSHPAWSVWVNGRFVCRGDWELGDFTWCPVRTRRRT